MGVIDPERWRAVEPLLDHALDLPEDERTAWLDELRAKSPTLAAEVAELLAGDAAGHPLLDDPPAALQRVLGEATLAGTTVGAYTLERPLGEGGMGAVWLARRTDGRFEGRAAVKLLHLALVTDAGREAFRREGSALARLTHPGIARLLDAGVTPGGQPYLVLEHVDGTPIDAYADEHRLPVSERLRLFLQVLAAVGHAHGNLVVHRDLKPSNILVTAADDDTPAVKLLDFGIAKLLGPGDDPAATPDARTVRGWMTPRYAAPEQLRGAPVTTRTDVYQLGAVLYELLAGRPAFEGRSPHDIESAVLGGTPPPPSATRTPSARELRGDLDAITLRALDADPERRYASADAFAEDIGRHLAGYPVRARRQTAGYRLRRLARRHRWAIAAGIGMLALLGAYVATVLADRARLARALAEATTGTRKSDEMADFAVGLFEASDRGEAYADTVTAQQLLARGDAQATELSGDPALRAQMLDVIGRIHTVLGEYDRARPPLAEALAIRRRLYGEDHPDVATSLVDLAKAVGATSDTGVVGLLREALAIRRRHFGNTDPRTIDALYELATLGHMSGHLPESEALLDEWLADVAPAQSQVTPARAYQLGSMASILESSGRRADAERVARQALAMDRTLFGDGHQRVGHDLYILGGDLEAQHRFPEAEATLRQSVAVLRASHAGGHVELPDALRNLGYVLNDERRWPESEAVWREALTEYERIRGPRDLAVANSAMQVGHALSEQDRVDEAVPYLRRAVTLYDALFPPSSPIGARARLYLGDALRKQGHPAEAEQMLLAGYAAVQRESEFTHTARRYALEALARLYDGEGQPAKAARYRAASGP